jgi:hypothetical protein
VSLEVIFRKSLSYGISDLVLGSYWEDLDESISHMLAKMMVPHIDVFSIRTKFWEPSEFQCTEVILKNRAIYVGLGTDDWKPFLSNFLNQKHNRKYVL